MTNSLMTSSFLSNSEMTASFLSEGGMTTSQCSCCNGDSNHGDCMTNSGYQMTNSGYQMTNSGIFGETILESDEKNANPSPRDGRPTDQVRPTK